MAIHFQFPASFWLLLLLIPIAGLFYANHRWKQQVLAKYADAHLLKRLLGGKASIKPHWQLTWILLSWLCLVLALANPQVKEGEVAPDSGNGLEIVLVMDVSQSMQAADVAPSRLELAKLQAQKLLNQIQGNRVGVVVFAGTAMLQLPLTTDIAAARLVIQALQPGQMPVQGTHLGEALLVAVQSFPVNQNGAVAIVFSDGESLDGDAKDGLAACRNAGVAVFCLGVGSETGAILPGEDGLPIIDLEGKKVTTKADWGLLKKVATTTDGAFLALAQDEKWLEWMATRLNKISTHPLPNFNRINFYSLSFLPLFAAIVLLIIASGFMPISLKWKAIVKKKKLPLVWVMLFCGTAVVAQSQKKQAEVMVEANKAYRNGNWEKAAKSYQEVLITAPNQPLALFNLGNIALKNATSLEKNDFFNRVVANTSQQIVQAAAYNNEGLRLAQMNQPDLAVQSFTKALCLQPNDGIIIGNLQKALSERRKQQQLSTPNRPPLTNQQKKDNVQKQLEAIREDERKTRKKLNSPKGKAINKW